MKLPAMLPSSRQKSAEALFDEACRDANLPPKDSLYIILQEVRGQVATLSVMVQAIRDRNQSLETRLAVVLEQARRQDMMRECKEIAQKTKESLICTVHFMLTQPKAPS